MKILVCISKTSDTTAKIAFTDNNTKFATEGVQWILNPYDEWYALVKAIELKEQDPTCIIHLLMVGPAAVDPLIRKALALGGDEAIRIDCDPQTGQQIAAQIAAYVSNEPYDLILLGKETIDYNGGAIGAMLAEHLAWDHIPQANSLQRNGHSFMIRHEVNEGTATSEAAPPLVLSCQKGMGEQRIPTMKGIMSARTKPLKVLVPVPFNEPTWWKTFTQPPDKGGVTIIPANQPEELIRLLHEEAKVF